MQGGDENYLALNGYALETGRNFSTIEIENGRSVCIIGNELVQKLFNENATAAIGKTIKVGGLPYLVIGTLRAKGASAFLNLDNLVITTYNNVRRQPDAGTSFNIGIMVSDLYPDG